MTQTSRQSIDRMQGVGAAGSLLLACANAGLESQKARALFDQVAMRQRRKRAVGEVHLIARLAVAPRELVKLVQRRLIFLQ